MSHDDKHDESFEAWWSTAGFKQYHAVSGHTVAKAAWQAAQSATRDTIIEECAKVCDETAQFQSEMALNTNTEESMVTYRKARAWDASVCAAKIRALKRHDDIGSGR